MDHRPDLGAVAHLVGDPSRLKMLAALLAKGKLTAGELAAAAGVTPQTASAHLTKLQRGELIEHTHGAYYTRQRLFRLTGDDVARAVEALSALATAEPRSSLKTNEPRAKLCYSHLGGTLGSALLTALLEQTLLEPIRARFNAVYEYRLTAEGAEVLGRFGVDVTGLQKQRRRFARRCMNAHEADGHLSGSLADALLKGLLARGWIKPDDSKDRALVLTEVGEDGLASRFAVRLVDS